MTVQETILSFPGLSDFSDFLAKVLVDRSLDGAEGYTVSAKQKVDLAAADMYRFVVNSYDFTENKFSIKMSREDMRRTAIELYREHGEYDKVNLLANKVTVSRGKAKNIW